MDREAFYAWIWETWGEKGLMGVHEGSVLSEEAAEKGMETESWTLDAGEAPRERDWINGQELAEAELYFESEAQASLARGELAKLSGLSAGEIVEQKPEDWDAKWKASFQGVDVAPDWRILPPWVEATESERATRRILRLNPGAGFGTGTHETTQLCLGALVELGLGGKRVLDFGSGSGILSIAAALLGAEVDGVEIDPLAIDNAVENAALNGLAVGEARTEARARLRFAQTLESARGEYSGVVANILRPVLVEFAPELVRRLKRPGGFVVLSGLMQPDVAEVSETYSALLGGSRPELRELGEWRALIWRGRA